jgi:hypothetical protein
MERKYLTEWKKYLAENLNQSYEQGVEYIKSKIKSLGMKLVDTEDERVYMPNSNDNAYIFFIKNPYENPADAKLSAHGKLSRKELKQSASIRVHWEYDYENDMFRLRVRGEENKDPNKTGGTWTGSLSRKLPNRKPLPKDITSKGEVIPNSQIDTFLADVKKVIDNAPDKKDFKTVSKARKQYIKKFNKSMRDE